MNKLDEIRSRLDKACAQAQVTATDADSSCEDAMYAVLGEAWIFGEVTADEVDLLAAECGFPFWETA
jgi:hypothetical protein